MNLYLENTKIKESTEKYKRVYPKGPSYGKNSTEGNTAIQYERAMQPTLLFQLVPRARLHVEHVQPLRNQQVQVLQTHCPSKFAC